MAPHFRLAVIPVAVLASFQVVSPTATPSDARREHTIAPEFSRATGGFGLRAVSLNVNFALRDQAIRRQLSIAHQWSPDVLLLQEVAGRRELLSRWAGRHGYQLLPVPGGSADVARHESSVLYRDDGRFTLASSFVTAGSAPVRRANGELIGARFIATARVHDHLTGHLLSFSSTHMVPEVQWWDRERPRRGRATLAAFRGHVGQVRSVLEADLAADAISILGGDFNASAAREAAWPGFMTRVFGHLVVSNHDVLGAIGTHESDTLGETHAIDYIYASRDPRVRLLTQTALNLASDHHALVVDLELRTAA